MPSFEEVAGSQAAAIKKIIKLQLNYINNNLISLLLNFGVVLMFNKLFFFRLVIYIYILIYMKYNINIISIILI